MENYHSLKLNSASIPEWLAHPEALTRGVPAVHGNCYAVDQL
jgi:hypothetical protein